MEESQQQQQQGLLCINNCGFFGNRTTMNLCSKCFKDLSNSNNNSAAAAPISISISGDNVAAHPVPVVLTKSLISSAAGSSSQASAESAAAAAVDSSSLHQPERCFSCRKRLGLTGFKCRCGNLFCAVHRYSERHECGFDYKAMARESIAKANPLVVARKIHKI